MLSSEIVVTIPGHPKPKGSLKCIGGRGGRGHVLIEDNPGTKEWRNTVAGWIVSRVHSTADKGQALGAEVTLTIERPKSVKRTYPTSRSSYDVDKLLRLILDALQDTPLLPDDAQICEVTARKAYPHDPGPLRHPHDIFHADALPYPGVLIRLYPLEVPQ